MDKMLVNFGVKYHFEPHLKINIMKMLFLKKISKIVFAFTNALKELDSLFLEQLNVITNISTKVV